MKNAVAAVMNCTTTDLYAEHKTTEIMRRHLQENNRLQDKNNHRFKFNIICNENFVNIHFKNNMFEQVQNRLVCNHCFIIKNRGKTGEIYKLENVIQALQQREIQ